MTFLWERGDLLTSIMYIIIDMWPDRHLGVGALHLIVKLWLPRVSVYTAKAQHGHGTD